MGTNFYTLKGKHLGRRSASGLYCWDCGVTLRVGGSGLVHHSDAKSPFDHETKKLEWHDKCPICGKVPMEETLSSGAAGRELGFNKGPYGKKTGVASCSSFTWAVLKSELRKLKYVKDEYGRKMTKEEFCQILEECPIQFFDSIGEEFC